MDIPEIEEGFWRGEIVRLKGAPHQTGQVVNERDWGGEYLVRLTGTLSEFWFRDCELEAGEVPPQPKGGDLSNVINLATVRAKGCA